MSYLTTSQVKSLADAIDQQFFHLHKISEAKSASVLESKSAVAINSHSFHAPKTSELKLASVPIDGIDFPEKSEKEIFLEKYYDKRLAFLRKFYSEVKDLEKKCDIKFLYERTLPKGSKNNPKNFGELVNRFSFDAVEVDEKSKKDFETFDQDLANLRKSILNRYSSVIKWQKQEVRVFNEEQKIDVERVFARCIDAARGALLVLNCHDRGKDKTQHIQRVKCALKKCKERMAKFANKFKGYYSKSDLELLKLAEKESRRFLGVLEDELSRAGVEKAKKAILIARDFLFKKTFRHEAFCTVFKEKETEEDSELAFTFRYTEPVEAEAEFSSWNDKNDGAWFQKLLLQFDKQKTSGNWFFYFVNQNIKDLKVLPTTPMSRGIPGLGGLYTKTTASLKQNVETSNNTVIQVQHSTLTATTEPYEVEDESDRQSLTLANHRALFESDKRLDDIENAFYDRWDGLIEKGKYKGSIIILDQNLISDDISGEDQRKSQTILKTKKAANVFIRRRVNRIKTNRDDKVGTFELLETNNCINMHANYSRVRDNDYDHSRILVRSAAIFLREAFRFLGWERNEDVKDILAFLEDGDHSFLSEDLSLKPIIEQYLFGVSDEIRKSEKLPETTRNNLAMLLQAAVGLKCVVHESTLQAKGRTFFSYLAKPHDYLALSPNVSIALSVILWAGMITLCSLLFAGVLAIPVVGQLIGISAFTAFFISRWGVNAPKMMWIPVALSAAYASVCIAMKSIISLKAIAVIAIAAIPVWGQILTACVLGAYLLYKLFKKPTARKSIYKAKFEQEIAGLLGCSVPKCMSSSDRLNAVAELVLEDQKRFAKTGKIVLMNSEGEREVYKKGPTTAKANTNEMTTGVRIAKDRETYGGYFGCLAKRFFGFNVFSMWRKPEEEAVDLALKNLRKYDKSIRGSMSDYLEEGLEVTRKGGKVELTEFSEPNPDRSSSASLLLMKSM